MARTYRVTVPFASEDGKSINELLTVDDLLSVSEPIIDRAILPIEEALSKANLRPQDIDMIILAGGSSQLPRVSEKIEHLLGKRPRKIPRKLMLAVSYGAALYHRDLLNLPQLRSESRILGEDMGLRVSDRGRQTSKLLMPHNTTLPREEEFTFPVAQGQKRATIQLVVLDSVTGEVKYYLKQRDLVLSQLATHIQVKLSVDENRLISVTAYNPDHPEDQSTICVSQSKLSEIEAQSYRDKLGITIEEHTKAGISQQCIGIDLGTTTSELATATRSTDVAELDELENPDINRANGLLAPYCFPSIVYFPNGTNNIEISSTTALNARNDANADDKIFYNFKTQPIEKELGSVNDTPLRMQDLSAYVLSKIWSTAQSEFDGSLTSAVITVPAAFTVDQCEATYNAAIMAGIPNVTLIDEPTAAYYYYRHIQQIDSERIKNVLVFDFGGGTADIAILDVSGGGKQLSSFKDNIFAVKATSGDPTCGGRDIDKALLDEVVHRFEVKNDTKVTPAALNKLKDKIEEAKVKLSEAYADSMED